MCASLAPTLSRRHDTFSPAGGRCLSWEGEMRVTKRRVVAVMLLATLMLVLMAGTAWAGVDPSTALDPKGASAKGIGEVATSLNLLWVVIGAVLVIFMQAGFALVETGFCRAKHAAHVVSTNFAIFALGFVGFYFIGYGLMFGGYSLPLIGMDTPVGKNLLGSGDWVFLWQGGWAGSGKSFYTAGGMAF